MKQNLITDVVQAMLPYLNNAQAEKLQEVLQRSLTHYDVVENDNEKENSEQNLVELFLSAKRIEVYHNRGYTLLSNRLPGTKAIKQGYD